MASTAQDDKIKMATVLKHIVEDKYCWLTEQKRYKPLDAFQQHIKQSSRNFYAALNAIETVFILECKKASPSKGLIRADFNLFSIAKVYKRYASVISVLTDEKYFQGSFDFLALVSNEAPQPILCKDFIIDEYQIYLARFYNADAILLMLSILTDEEYEHLSQIAHQLNMGILTEASSFSEVQRAVKLGAKVIGINNRDLRDLSVDLNRVKQLSKFIPSDRIIISESGIYNHRQINELKSFSNGFLIGTALMSEPDLELAIRKLMWGENKVCGLTNTNDAVSAYHAGAVFGGLIFVRHSKRYIKLASARLVINAAPLNWVGVFQNQTINEVSYIAHELSLHAVQLHGDEDDAYFQELQQKLPQKCQIWKALSLSKQVPEYHNPNISRYIFDYGSGGSGKSFDWSILEGHDLSNVILAGGIHVDNITAAIKTGCAGVDLNSGVEIAPGIKDSSKMNSIFKTIKLMNKKRNMHA